MSCPGSETIAKLEAGLLDEDAQGRELRAHVDACGECRTRQAELAAAAKLVATLGDLEPAPRPDTWDAIVERTKNPADGPLAVAIACVFCKGKLVRPEAVYCAACLAPHHGDCWTELGRCAACANATSVRPTVASPPPRRALARIALMAVVASLGGAGWYVAATLPPPREEHVSGGPPLPDPIDPRVFYLRAHDQIALGKLDGAAESLEQYLRKRRDDAEALVLLGDVRARLERWTEAEEAYRRASTLGAPSSVWRSRARADLELDAPARALESLATAARVGDNSPESFVVAARACLALEDLVNARIAIGEALRRDPATPGGHEVAGEIELAAGDLAAAERDLWAVGPGPECELAIGELCERKLDDAGAARAYDQAARGKSGVAVRALARAGQLVAFASDAPGADGKKTIQRARSLIDRALELDASSAEALVARGRLELASDLPRDLPAAQRDLAAARTLLAARLAKVSTKGRARSLAEAEALLGLALLRDGQADAALEPLRSAKARAPRSPLVLAALGFALQKDAEGRELLATARAAAAEPDPDDQAARWYLDGLAAAKAARASRAPRDYLRARAALGRAAALNPLHALAHLARARLASEWRAWDLARREARAAVESDPTLREAHELAGTLGGAPTDPAAALAELELAVVGAPEGADGVRVHVALARALLAAGKQDRALAELETALRLAPSPRLLLGNPESTEGFRAVLELHRLRASVLAAAGKTELAYEAEFAAAALAEGASAEARVASDNERTELRQGKLENAIALCHRALELDPTLFDARRMRCEARLCLAARSRGALFFSADLGEDVAHVPGELVARLADLRQLAATDETTRALAEVALVLVDAPDHPELHLLRAICLESRASIGAPADLTLALNDLDRAIAASRENEVVGRAWRTIVLARGVRASFSPDERARLVAKARKDAARFAGEKTGLALLVQAAFAAAESEDDPRHAAVAIQAIEDAAASVERLDLSRDPLFEGLSKRAEAAEVVPAEPAPVASPKLTTPRPGEYRYVGKFQSFNERAAFITLQENVVVMLDQRAATNQVVLAKISSLKVGDPVTLVLFKTKVVDVEVRKERER
jgi:tetratricopeptide (TPR) repeat protein